MSKVCVCFVNHIYISYIFNRIRTSYTLKIKRNLNEYTLGFYALSGDYLDILNHVNNN